MEFIETDNKKMLAEKAKEGVLGAKIKDIPLKKWVNLSVADFQKALTYFLNQDPEHVLTAISLKNNK